MSDHAAEYRPMRTIDWLIVGLIVLASVLPFLMASASSDHRQTLKTAGTGLAVAGCVLMFSWMWFADGARSRLWRWLPPFWPWGRLLTGAASRWCLVMHCLGYSYRKIFQMSRTRSNNPAAGKAGIPSRLAIGHHCPGLPEPGRWTTLTLIE